MTHSANSDNKKLNPLLNIAGNKWKRRKLLVFIMIGFKECMALILRLNIDITVFF